MTAQRVELTYKFWVDMMNMPTPSTLLRELAVSEDFPKLFPELSALRDTPQGKDYHPEGVVLEHVFQSMDVARTLSEDFSEQDRMIATLSALCHDLGKATHTVIQEDGSITSQNHATAGVEPTGSFLTRIGAPQFVIDSVKLLVSIHMVHVNAVTSAMVRRLMEKLHANGLTMNHLAVLVDSDTGGRGTASWQRFGSELLAMEQWVVNYDATRKRNDKLNGHMLMSFGLKPSPMFSSIIREYTRLGLDLPDDELKAWVLDQVNSSSG